jgi:hypothetical protein
MLRHSITAKKSVFFLGRILFWPLLIFAIFISALEAGFWQSSEFHSGPFKPDPFAGSAERANLSVGFATIEEHPFKCCFSVRSDVNEHPDRSDLRLWINGKEVAPAHEIDHDQIRSGQSHGFSFWNHIVIFALPAGQANDASAVAEVRYALKPPENLALFLLTLVVLLAAAVYRGAISRARRWSSTVIAPALTTVFLSTFYFCALGSVIYALITAWAAFTGWALPTTAAIRLSPAVEWLARNEIYLGYALLVVAAIGAVAGLDRPNRDSASSRWFWPTAVLVTFSALVLSLSAMWAGLIRPGDLQGINIGGLIAFSDAGGHLANAYDQARDGVFSVFALRRPIAASFRSALLFYSFYSLPTMQLMQVALLAGVICLAAWAVNRWKGPVAALVFFALTYIYVRVFAPVTLTEPLGLIWGIFSIPFFTEALRRKSRRMALFGFAILTIGLMTRMGSMFTIPALSVWLILQFGSSLRERLRVGAIVLAILGVIFAANSALTKLYGTPGSIPGSNFSYTLCGLTLGTDWGGCLKQMEHRGETPKSEADTVNRLYELALENFKAEPSRLFLRLNESAQEFLTTLPSLLLRGYLRPLTEPWWFPSSFLLLLTTIGIGRYLLRKNSEELLFFSITLISIVVSAGFVFFDDGNRVLAVTFPLVFLFIAAASARQGVRPSTETNRAGLETLGTIALLFAAISLCIPWVAYRTFAMDAATTAGSGADIFGGRRMAGFLVVADNAPLGHDVPTLHLKDFEQIITKSGVEGYQGLIHPEVPPLPFAFIFAPRISGVSSDYQFIVPPEVLQRKNVPRWRLQLKSWNRKEGMGQYWFFATSAQPLL